MKAILNTVSMRWNVKGVGSFARKEDALAAIAERSKSRMIQVRVKPEMYEALVDAANERRMSISEIIRMAIEKEVKS